MNKIALASVLLLLSPAAGASPYRDAHPGRRAPATSRRQAVVVSRPNYPFIGRGRSSSPSLGDVRVWADTDNALYYIPGTPECGRGHGLFMKQSAAARAGFKQG